MLSNESVKNTWVKSSWFSKHCQRHNSTTSILNKWQVYKPVHNTRSIWLDQLSNVTNMTIDNCLSVWEQCRQQVFMWTFQSQIVFTTSIKVIEITSTFRECASKHSYCKQYPYTSPAAMQTRMPSIIGLSKLAHHLSEGTTIHTTPYYTIPHIPYQTYHTISYHNISYHTSFLREPPSTVCREVARGRGTPN